MSQVKERNAVHRLSKLTGLVRSALLKNGYNIMISKRKTSGSSYVHLISNLTINRMGRTWPQVTSNIEYKFHLMK